MLVIRALTEVRGLQNAKLVIYEGAFAEAMHCANGIIEVDTGRDVGLFMGPGEYEIIRDDDARDEEVKRLKAELEDWRDIHGADDPVDAIRQHSVYGKPLRQAARLKAIVDQVRSRYELLQKNGPDVTSADGEWISASWLEELGEQATNEDICGFCGLPGADKIPHPVRWPGEESAGTDYVHAGCEQLECIRAHAALSDEERKQFLATI